MLPELPNETLPCTHIPLHSTDDYEPEADCTEKKDDTPIKKEASPRPAPPPVAEEDEHIVITSVEPSYENMTVKELRDMCRSKEIAHDGKKAELVQRLTALVA